MVGVLPRHLADVEGPGAVPYKAQPEFLRQLRVKDPHLRGGEIHRPAQVIPAAEVHGAEDQRLVHGQQELPVADNAPLVSQGLLKRPAQTDAGVLHGVVIVYLGVSLTDNGEIEIPVPGEELQHVVQKAAAGADVRLSGAVQIQGQLYPRLPCVALNARGAHGVFLLTSRPSGG